MFTPTACQGPGRRWLVPILAMALFLIPGSRAAAQKLHPAEEKGTARSFQSEIATSIEFYNFGPQPIKVYWLDTAGKRELRDTLKARERRVYQTFLTHPWLLTDEKDNALGLYYPDAAKRVVTYGFPPNRGSGGPPGGGGGFPGAAVFPATRLALAQDKAVQTELKLSDEQLAAIGALVTKYGDASRAFDGLATLERLRKVSEVRKKSEDAITETLNPAQKKRLDQIYRQEQGGYLFSDKTIAAALTLNPEQVEKMRGLQREHNTQVQELTRSQSQGTPEFTKRYAEVRRAVFAATSAFLTPDQRSIWQDLIGEPFAGMSRATPFAPRSGSTVDPGASVAGAFRGRFTLGNLNGSMIYLAEKSVQDDLKLSDDQLQRIATMPRAPGGGISPNIKDVLTPAQLDRYQGIYLQVRMRVYGPATPFRYANVRKLLQLSEEQTAKILAIGLEDAKSFVALDRIGERPAPDKLAALDASTDAKLKDVLTPEQRSRLQAYLGPPFTGAIQSALGRPWPWPTTERVKGSRGGKAKIPPKDLP